MVKYSVKRGFYTGTIFKKDFDASQIEAVYTKKSRIFLVLKNGEEDGLLLDFMERPKLIDYLINCRISFEDKDSTEDPEEPANYVSEAKANEMREQLINLAVDYGVEYMRAKYNTEGNFEVRRIEGHRSGVSAEFTLMKNYQAVGEPFKMEFFYLEKYDKYTDECIYGEVYTVDDAIELKEDIAWEIDWILGSKES